MNQSVSSPFAAVGSEFDEEISVGGSDDQVVVTTDKVTPPAPRAQALDSNACIATAASVAEDDDWGDWE